MSVRGEVTDDAWTRTLVGAGEIFRASGEVASAAAVKEELLKRAKNYGTSDPLLIPAVLVNLSDMAMEAGDFKRARDLGEQSLELRVARDLNPARALVSLGELDLREGDLASAETLLEEAMRGFAALRDEGGEASALAALGEVARQRGDDKTATVRFVEALRRAVALGNGGIAGDCLQGLAVLAKAHGDAIRASQLWGTGQALLRLHGSTSTRVRQVAGLAELSNVEPRSVSLEEGMALALEAVESANSTPPA
jgi:tetratricopeptide (TPR) repeat protein